MKLKAAILVDKMCLSHWQMEALNFASDLFDVTLILNCKNTKTKKRFLKNCLYYVMNVISIKSEQTEKISVDFDCDVLNFDSDYHGAWQALPSHVTDTIKEKQIDIIIKFGLSLLRVNDDLVSIPIFSFHHGDPRKYRGRPAGFYELLNNEDKSGVMVQAISNKLDAGKVYALGFSKLFHHSYKATSKNFYKISKFLLRDAIKNWKNERFIQIDKYGKNYTLPSNLTVLEFGLKVLWRKINRIIYGMFFEKKWQVGVFDWSDLMKGQNIITIEDLEFLEPPKEFTFLADPFFSYDGKEVRVEAMDRKTGLGDIIEIDLESKKWNRILSGAHYSYPFSIRDNDVEYLVPEVASHSSPWLVDSSDFNGERLAIKGLENKHVVDLTVLRFEEHYYLFFSEAESASNVLQLYHGESLKGLFEPHPSSPIVIDPSSARMGGRILNTELGLLRFGQENSRVYGASLNAFKIERISPEEYKETKIASLSFENLMGPHTLDVSYAHQRAVVDLYEERFSMMAGYRRVSAFIRRSVDD